MSGSGNTSDNKPGQGEDTMKDVGKGIDAPRLTPQGRADPDAAGEDETSPQGGAKTGQPSKAEG
jgi:hypothetical protein